MAHPLSGAGLTRPDVRGDRETGVAVVAEVPRCTAGLSGRLAALAVRASRTGRTLQVLTPAHTMITVPLEQMLLGVRGSWVRRDGDGFRCGLSGASIRWTGMRFEPSGPSPPPTEIRVGGLEVQVVTTHRGADGFGHAAVHAVSRLTGREPVGWGVAEPATQPWSRQAVVRHCVERAPDPTSLVVVGAGAVGTLRADPHIDGVRERVHIGGPVADRVGASRMEELADLVAPSARTMIVSIRPGLVDGVRSPGRLPAAIPWGLLLGAEVVAENGIEHARTAPATSVRLTDGACWCRLTQGEIPAVAQLAAVLAHFGGRSPQ